MLLAVATALASASAAYALAAGGTGGAAPAPAQLVIGKRLYRTYCGQCHALTAALAAGFGSGNGLGTYGGPSFDNLRVPFNLCLISVTETFAGHEVIFNKMTFAQVKVVPTHVATVTKPHPVLATSIYAPTSSPQPRVA